MMAIRYAAAVSLAFGIGGVAATCPVVGRTRAAFMTPSSSRHHHVVLKTGTVAGKRSRQEQALHYSFPFIRGNGTITAVPVEDYRNDVNVPVDDEGGESSSIETTFFDDIRVNGVTLSSKPAGRGRRPTTHKTSAFRRSDDDDDDDAKFILPRHPDHGGVNEVLEGAEDSLRTLRETSRASDESSAEAGGTTRGPKGCEGQNFSNNVFANSYVDLGKIDAVGFDFDYTLVTYSTDLLSLLYDMALERLVSEKLYPAEMSHALRGKFDPLFSIRGLAVDRETGWICHLSHTHKVAVAWEGRRQVDGERLVREYVKGKKGALNRIERKKRLKPLNDLFSMAECCLIADTIQFFKDRGIPFFPRSCVEDILSVIGSTHMSGDFHRLIASEPQRYLKRRPHLASVLGALKSSGKKLILVSLLVLMKKLDENCALRNLGCAWPNEIQLSNSPFWYVDAGMRHVIGSGWRDVWDAVIVSAEKPSFYTDEARPFREVSTETGRIKFRKVDRLESGKVYTQGCLRELSRCFQWNNVSEASSPTSNSRLQCQLNAGYSLAGSNVLYVGDSLFTDLVDAKREYGWTTAAITPEVDSELALQSQTDYVVAQEAIELLIRSLCQVQNVFGARKRSEEDKMLMDQLEQLVSVWRDEQINLFGSPFGSVFRARYQPSLFAHSLRRYCDLYIPCVESFRHFSPDHRFYPEDSTMLGHEVRRNRPVR